VPNTNPSPKGVGDSLQIAAGTTPNKDLGQDDTVLGRDEFLFRPFRNIVVSATAEDNIFKVGDTVSFDVVVYDSRSGITKKPDGIVAEGIRNYLAQKPVRFRHIDPNKDAYSLLGDVGTRPPVINNLIASDGSSYMEVISPLVLKARSEEHVNLIGMIMKKAEQYEKTRDKNNLMGVSLGWIESQSEFVPHEVSITPYPRCEQCVIVPGSQQLVQATAESGNSCSCQSNKGEKSLTDESKIEKIKEELFDQRMLVKERDTEIASLKAELSEEKLKAANALEMKLADVQSQHDTILAERTGVIDTLKAEVESLKAEVHTAKTMPLRKEIAEQILGYKAEEATAKIESLGKMSVEGLTQMRDDLNKSAALAKEAAEKKLNLDEPLPFLAGGDSVTPNIAEGTDMNLSDMDFAERFLGKEMFASIGRGR